MTQFKETTLLDSSLNTVPLFANYTINPYKKYNIKVIDCKGFKQLYIFEKDKFHRYNDIENSLHNVEYNITNSKSIKKTKNVIDNEVLFKNVMRSKLKLQRLAKANADEWKTFITLTFKDNITDLGLAYNKFRNFIRSIDRLKKDFKWLCVPEFQKSGRVHYHLVTNIDLEDKKIIEIQYLEDKIYYHTKQWQKNGFDCIETIKDKDGNDTKKLCGYISKYMTKSYIEDCFYNKNRYYSSQNLTRPYEIYFDLSNKEDLNKLEDLLKNSDIIYDNTYKDSLDNNVTFIELKN